MMYWNGDWGAWAWLAMTVSMLLFWSLVGIAVWLLVRRPAEAEPPGGGEGAEELLRRRYAAGEIDEPEFERRLGGLREHSRR